MTLGIAIAGVSSLDATWTTLHLARAALARGVPVRLLEPWDIEIDERGRATARAYALDAPAEAEALVEALQRHAVPRVVVRLDELDVLLMRIAPLHSGVLALAAVAEAAGVRVVNSPSGMLRVSHKGWLASLPDVPTPTTLVTRSPGAAHLFLARQGGPVVVKPAQGSGGRAVTLVATGDGEGLDRAFRLASAGGRHVVVQSYLPEAVHGEKRLVWMDGHVLGGYLRRRAPGEFRHNLKQGGVAEPTTVTAAEHALIAPLGRHLLHNGVRLAGIDLIGHHVVEVNAQNPGGAFHADRLHGTDIAGTIVTALVPDARDATRSTPWAHPAP